MAKVAFILLTHKDPETVIRQAQTLTATGDYVAIHYDGRASGADFVRIQDALKSNPAVTFARRRHKCGWGEWSLVAATLEAVTAAAKAFPQASHFYMLSGDCMQIKTAEFVHAFLDADDVDYIESFDFITSGWIKTGIRQERLIYRHWFNERSQKWLFYKSLEWQQRLHIVREVPSDIQMMIGSQWWCLRRTTVERILEFCAERADVMRFFKTTWIPDETFFQTIVRHVTPNAEIRARTLTFLAFTDYGVPVTFYNDHFDMLVSQNYLFARKISPGAAEMKERLFALWGQKGVDFAISDVGRNLFQFATSRGRIGYRFAPRFWEMDTRLGRGRTLIILVCKKWHVAKRLADQIAHHTDVPTVNYLFNEDGGLPNLGGIERTLVKRNRHRRSLLRMLFDYHNSDRLLMCVDPADFDLIDDLARSNENSYIIDISVSFDDNYLQGHARRTGLASGNTPDVSMRALLQSIRYDLKYESDRLVDAGFPGFARIEETNSLDRNVAVLSRSLDIDAQTARDILSLDYLYAD